MHRIDRFTSGLLVVARTPIARVRLVERFKLHENVDVYAKIGSGLVVAREVFKAIFPGHKTGIVKRPSADFPRDSADFAPPFLPFAFWLSR